MHQNHRQKLTTITDRIQVKHEIFVFFSVISFSFKDKLIYVANYDFNGTSSANELSFRKGDRLEILDRYS